MTYKNNINVNPRTFYFSKGGGEEEAGESLETAAATIQSAVDKVNALSPPPTVTDPSAILSSGSGAFSEPDIVIPEGCQFNGQDIRNFPVTGNAFNPGERASFRISSAGTIAPFTTVFTINNKSEIGLESQACVCLGANSTGVHVLGASDDIFVTISQLQLSADGCVGILDETDNGAPETYNVNELLLEGNSTTGFKHNPSISSSEAILNMGFIGEVGSFTGTTAIEVANGIVNAFVNTISADTAVTLTSGVLNLSSQKVAGNITVGNGAVLNANIIGYEGTITNNGTINGFINGVRYGKGNSESTSFSAGGLITQGALNTQINISSGIGTIYDYSLPVGNGEFSIEWPSFVDVDLTFAATELFSFIAIDRNGAVQQFAPNGLQFVGRRDFIVLGTVQHTAGIFQQSNSNYISARETHAQLLDLLDCLGVINCEGFTVQPNSDLTFDKTAGILMNPGAGNAQGNRSENAASILAESPTIFSRTLGITGTSATVGQTSIDPANFDDGSGSPVAVGGGANSSTIQYIFQFPTDGAVFVQYGQTVYPTLLEAVAQASVDNPTIPLFVRQDALLVARVAMEKGAIDLTDTAMVEFLPGAKFGVDITGGSGGSGAGGGDFFGPASSVINELLTFADTTGKIGNSTSNIIALAGSLQRILANGDLEIIRNGTGKVQIGSGTITGKTGVAEALGSTIWDIAAILGGDAGTRFIPDGVGRGEVGYENFNDILRFIDFVTSRGLFIEADGQISIGAREVDPNFSVIIGDADKPFGLPILSTADEGAVTGVDRMIHYNSILDRIRFWNGADNEFQSLAIEGQNAIFESARNSTDTDISSVNTYIIINNGGNLTLSQGKNWELFGADRMRYSGPGTWTGIVTCDLQISNPNATLTREYDIRPFVNGNAIGTFWDLLNVLTSNSDFRHLTFSTRISIPSTHAFDPRIKIKTGGTGSADGSRITNASFTFMELK